MSPEQYRRIGEIYRAALELGVGDWEVFLAKACGGDENLRQEVASLLAQRSKADQWIDHPAVEIAARALATPQSDSWVGQQVHHYKVTSLLGAGGMGQVYRACDIRLGRDVAIKVLPTTYSSNSEWLHRFEREARAAGTLNHPNVLTVYDVGVYNGAPYIVAEVLEGEDLRALLQRGAISQRRALDFARQIASGLAAAHAKDIVHRDLKPENLFITIDGRLKILDFGLAKLKSPAGADSDPMKTIPGMLMGTPGYMSPEQVRGQEADPRSDIFVLGIIFYEMLSGVRPFQGESATEVLNAILKTELPDLSETHPDIPPVLGRVVRRCLEKMPDQRFQSASDFCFTVEALPSIDVRKRPRPEGFGLRAQSVRIAWMVAALAIVALLIVSGWRRAGSRTTGTVREPVMFKFGAPEGATLVVDDRPEPAPDGRQIAFVVQEGSGRTALWVRSLDGEPRRIAGTDDARYPFWSPDGKELAFFADGLLKRIALSGGPPQTVARAPAQSSGAWSPSGDIVFTAASRSPLMRVPAAGGTPQVITTLDEKRGENSHRYPKFLPDGKRFLFTARSSLREETAIYVGSLDSTEIKRVLTAQSNAVYVSPGYVLYGQEGTLMARPFDLAKLEFTGDAFPIAGGIRQATESALTSFSASADGSLVAYLANTEAQELTWFDRTGSKLGVVGLAGRYRSPRLSPDGKRVTVEITDSQTRNRDIWLVDLATGLPFRWTTNPANDWNAVWSPDGASIAFASDRTSPSSIFLKPVDGGEEKLLVASDSGNAFPVSWSPNGQWLAYNFLPKNSTQMDLWLSPFFGERQSHAFVATEFDEREPQFSSDSQWLAYTSDKSGAHEIYIRSVTGTGDRRISTRGGYHATWRRDGKELFYMAPGGDLMAAPVTPGDPQQIGNPKVLFRACTTPTLFYSQYTPDVNGRFLFVCPTETKEKSITLLIQWTSIVNLPANETVKR